jgi:hypothetical protein
VIRHILARTAWIAGGTVVALFVYFFCERMFSGYHQYGTEIITYVGLAVVMGVAAYAWITDQRRLDADEHDGDE